MNKFSGTNRSDIIAAPASYLPLPSPRHRTLLNAGVASRAVIALPAALSLGVVLSSPTQAQTVTVGPSNAGVNLATNPNYRSSQSFTITSGTTISNAAGSGVYGGAVTISNAGSIASSVNGNGVDTEGVGTVSNSGTIRGGTGTNSYGVKINIGPSRLNNSGVISGWVGASANDTSTIYNGATGTITGSHIGVLQGEVNNNTGGTILNKGSIVATANDAQGGVVMQGGTFHNYSTGVVLSNSTGVYDYDRPTDVENDGKIIAGAADPSVASYGIHLAAGGTVTNTSGGTISGNTAAILIQGSAVPVYNEAGATITGGGFGIYSDITGDTITNQGTIEQTATAASQVTGTLGTQFSAIYLKNGGSFTNTSTGVVDGGEYGIRSDVAAITISNSGSIGGLQGGVALLNGGTISNSSTGTITSADGAALSLGGTVATLQNSGVINGATSGINVTGGGTIINNSSGTITGNAHGIIAENNPVYVLNNGTILSNTEPAIDLTAGGTVSNSSTGLISGGVNGVYITGGVGTVINTGTITTTGTHAIVLEDGGSVINSGSVISQGTIGIEINGDPGTLVNAGNIVATSNAAVQFPEGGSVTNNAGQTISGATYGIHIYGGASSITNFGTIDATAGNGVEISGGTFANAPGAVVEGTTFGLVFDGPGTGSNEGLIMDSGVAGLDLGSGVNFVNASTGTLSGTTGLIFSGTGSTLLNEGTIASDSGGDAVSFSGSGINFLTLTTGQVLIGTVDGGGSDSTIALDGTGTLTNTITDFGATSALNVAPNADWTASGNWQIATATNDGTFQPGIIGTPLNLSGNFVQNSDGTLRVIVTPAATNQLLVTGTAKLNGALIYNFAPGTYVAKTYPFLVTSGATTGSFSSITYNGAPGNLLHTTIYTPNDTNLVLYTAEDPPLIVTPIDDSIFSDENQQSALNAQAASASLLQKAAEGDEAGAEAAVCAAQAGATPASVEPSKANRAEQLANAVGSAFCGAGGWIQGSGSIFNASGNANVDGYRADSAGFLAGIGKDINSQGTRLGVAVGYDESNVKTSLGSKGDIDTVRVGLYGSQPVGVFTIAGDIMYGHFDTTTSRVTGIGEAGSKDSGDIFSGGLEAETLLPIAGFDIVPGAGIRVASVGAGGFAESAPGAEQAFALDGAGSSYTSVQPFVNVDLSRKFVTPKSIAIMPDISVGYVYEAGTRGRAVTVDSQDGTSFQTAHVGLASSAAELQAGVSAGKGNWAFYARYTADLAGDFTSQTGEVGLRIRF